MADKLPDPAVQREAVRIIRDGIDKLLEKDPFFGHIMDQMVLTPDGKKEYPTIATNGRILTFGSDWIVERQSDIVTLLAHEASHVAFGHPYRQGDKDPEIYNKATDAVINDILMHRGYTLPGDSFCYPNARSMTSEQLYRLLKQQNPKGGGEGQDPQGGRKQKGQDFGGCFSPDEGTDAEEEAKAKGEAQGQGEAEAEDDVREGVAKAAQRARKAGKMPGQLETMIEQSSLSDKDWKDELKKYLGGGQIKEPTWSKPNRRYVYQGQYLPGNGKFGPGEIVLAIDVSGSIDSKLLERFLAEVRKINEDLQPDAIHVLTCDTRIPWSETFGPYDDVEVPAKAVTCGGTMFSPVFRWVTEQGIEPKALVYFTDLECNDFGDQPDYPVMWVVWPGGSTRKPWGDLIQMDD